jgi:glycosyltransferase involved in cell wall biosynthesis
MLQICPHEQPPFDALCARYAEAAGALGLACHTVYLSAPTHQGPTPQAPGADAASRICTHWLAAEDLADLRALRRSFERLSLPDRFELAVAHRYRSYRLLLAARVKAQRRVVLAHEYGLFARPRRRWLHRWRGRGVRPAGVAPAVQQELRAAVGDGLLLPNVIDWQGLQADLLSRADARAALGVADSGPLIGVVGRLHPKKRPALALAGFQRFAAQRPGASLVFVGTGELRDELEAAAGTATVRFCGFMPDVRRCYRAFDVLLLTSGPEEAFGMVALEALSAGVPVAAARVAGPQFVLGDLGCYFDTADADAVAAAIAEAVSVPLPEYAAAALARVQQQFSVSAGPPAGCTADGKLVLGRGGGGCRPAIVPVVNPCARTALARPVAAT